MAYSTQTDLENRIGSSNLARITNDTAGATTSTTAVVNSLIQRADALINGKCKQVYDTPLQEVLSGTISSSGVTLTGTSTAFTTELEIGDPLINRATGEIRIIDSITSATSATTSVAFTTLASATLYRIPQIIHTISVDLACFSGMQRRFSEMEMPSDWKSVWDRIMGTPQMKGLLDQIADLEIDIGLSVTSDEASIVAPDQVVTFTDTDTAMSEF
jgi:hypothetical protein